MRKILSIGLCLFTILTQAQQYSFDEFWDYTLTYKNEEKETSEFNYKLYLSNSKNHVALKQQDDEPKIIDYKNQKLYDLQFYTDYSTDETIKEINNIFDRSDIISVTNLNQKEIVDGFNTEIYDIVFIFNSKLFKGKIWLTNDIKPQGNILKILNTFVKKPLSVDIPNGIPIKAELKTNMLDLSISAKKNI